MIKHVGNVIDDFPKKLKSTDVAKTPAGDGLFNQGQGRKPAPADRAESHHTMEAASKGFLFLCKHARPDTQPMLLRCAQGAGTKIKLTGVSSSD